VAIASPFVDLQVACRVRGQALLLCEELGELTGVGGSEEHDGGEKENGRLKFNYAEVRLLAADACRRQGKR
jgi:hypothetical protein